MADRVSVTTRIGGALPADDLADFMQIIEIETLTNPLGGYFTPSQINGVEPVELGANEVAWAVSSSSKPSASSTDFRSSAGAAAIRANGKPNASFSTEQPCRVPTR